MNVIKMPISSVFVGGEGCVMFLLSSKEIEDMWMWKRSSFANGKEALLGWGLGNERMLVRFGFGVSSWPVKY